MGGQAVRRVGGWRARCPSVVGAVLLLAAGGAAGLAAQVGYDPSHSPYHDRPRGGIALVTFGYLGGSRGSVGVGISNGPTGGLRFETALGSAIAVSLGVAYAQTTRYVVDPTKDTLSRKTGPFDTDVVLADAGFQLVLTGRKSWHRLAPYVGGAVGLAIGGGSPPDTSGYTFGTKFTVTPSAGVRWYPSRRIAVRADVSAVLWKLSYPVSYKVPDQTDGVRVLPVTASLTEYTWHPWATIGAGWIF
ncbi:MAG TPA: hypothetical protein VH116_10105 [Gemmatimonadales bacterium]|nr:hypothetical protein [Gemmatimonadales bacterium]